MKVYGTGLGGAGSIVLQNSINNKISNISIVNANEHGLVLNESSSNTILYVMSTNIGNAGVYLLDSHKNLLNGITTANNDNASNRDGAGIIIESSNNNTVVDSTIVNNRLGGISLSNSPNNLLVNTVGSNNYTSFYITNNSNKLTFLNLVATNNSRHGIYLNNVNENYFSGILKVGNNVDTNCSVENAPASPGLIPTLCTDTGLDGSRAYAGQLSDAILEIDVTSSLSFIGKVLFDDPANSSDINGGATVTQLDDWLNFENSYRSWGLDGDSYPAINNKGPLPSCDNYGNTNQTATNETDCLAYGGIWRTDGRIWDWSLALGDNGDNGSPVLHEVLSLPSADDTITHTWSDTSSTTFLKHAVEILGDAVGNDNGLCESNEACIFTPNIGAYQGEGELIPAGPIVDSISGGLTGVILYRYETNGH